MDWFEKLTGFQELGYEETRARLVVEAGKLRSRINNASHGVGELEVVSLGTLRTRVASNPLPMGKLKFSVVIGDVRQMHREAGNAGAVFQVASQFNLLEMVGPRVTPEDGVTRYQSDATQGPACAIAAGAATIYRNYFAPVNGASGQSAQIQINTLDAIGATLSHAIGLSISELWEMRNGYALATRTGLVAIKKHLQTLLETEIDGLRSQLYIGLHRDVEVTDSPAIAGQKVSQVFCSALPVAYSGIPAAEWELFGRLILEAAYEATIRVATLNAQRGVSNVVFLTLLGGGAFGNRESWILAAMRRALRSAENMNLDIRLVSYGTLSASVAAFARDFE